MISNRSASAVLLTLGPLLYASSAGAAEVPSEDEPLVSRVRPGMYAVGDRIIDYRDLRARFRADPALPGAVFDRRARGLEAATWTLTGLAGAGVVAEAALLGIGAANDGAGNYFTTFIVPVVTAAFAIASTTTGLESMRMRRQAVELSVSSPEGADPARLDAPDGVRVEVGFTMRF